MPIIRTVGGIVEIHPMLPVSHRPPATQADADHRRDRAKEQERQDTDPASRLVQQAYQQQTHQAPTPKPSLLAQDLMTSPVTWVASDSTLREAWTMMQHKGIHHLPVMSAHGILVGMVSNHALLPYAHELESVGSPVTSAGHTVTRVMNSQILSATPTTEIREIVHVMLDEQVNAIPILDGSRHLVGILTTSDILKVLVHRSPLELWT